MGKYLRHCGVVIASPLESRWLERVLSGELWQQRIAVRQNGILICAADEDRELRIDQEEIRAPIRFDQEAYDLAEDVTKARLQVEFAKRGIRRIVQDQSWPSQPFEDVLRKWDERGWNDYRELKWVRNADTGYRARLCWTSRPSGLHVFFKVESPSGQCRRIHAHRYEGSFCYESDTHIKVSWLGPRTLVLERLESYASIVRILPGPAPDDFSLKAWSLDLGKIEEVGLYTQCVAAIQSGEDDLSEWEGYFNEEPIAPLTVVEGALW